MITLDKIPHVLTREFINSVRKEVIIVFGDNLRRRGNRGQAEVCRDLSNCYGVATKNLPCMDSAAFFDDRLFDVYQFHIDRDIEEIPKDDGRIIYVIPNIGRGYSMMPDVCPRLYDYLIEALNKIATNKGNF